MLRLNTRMAALCNLAVSNRRVLVVSFHCRKAIVLAFSDLFSKFFCLLHIRKVLDTKSLQEMICDRRVRLLHLTTIPIIVLQRACLLSAAYSHRNKTPRRRFRNTSAAARSMRARYKALNCCRYNHSRSVVRSSAS